MTRQPDAILCPDCADILERLHLHPQARRQEALLMARECASCEIPDGGEQ